MPSFEARITRLTLKALTGLYTRLPGGLSVKRQVLDSMSSLLPPVSGIHFRDTVVAGRQARWFEPAQRRHSAVIYYLIGGGYAVCSLKTHRNLISRVALSTGLSTFSLEYRLAPEHPWPACLDDARAGYEHLLATGCRAEEIIIAGDSAGGGLAMALLLSLRDAGRPLPAGAFLLSPYADLTWSCASLVENRHRDPMAAGMAMPWARWAIGDRDPAHPLVSPVFADLNGLPPLFIQAGADEVLRDNARMLYRRAEDAGLQVDYREWPGMFHVFQLMGHLAPESRASFEMIGRFTDRLLLSEKIS